MTDPMPRLQLSLACWDYDRTRALADGSVHPEGIDLIYHELLVEETFFRMLRNREFDAAEMSLSSYCVSLMREDPAFIAIPVFPSRWFRHYCSFGSPMPLFADTKMQECRKKRDGRTGMAMKAGSSRMSDTQYEDSDISAASNSRLRSILKNVSSTRSS